MKDPMPLIHVGAEFHALMTRDAAERLKQLVPGELLGGDRVDVALEPTIKSAPGRGPSLFLVTT